MKPSDRIIDQPWLTGDGADQVMAVLHTHGARARFVGGCVRDALLDRPVRDIDIATELPPEAVVDLVEGAGLRAIPTGLQHGTVTVVAGGHPFEVTTLRRDVETDGRRATVEFTDDWLEDARRRDFTFNALYCDPDGTIYDPVNGLGDLAAGHVRFIGDPVQRILEDSLRILRFFRFHAWFGDDPLDSYGLAACVANKERLDVLSVERIRSELLRLLEAPVPVPVLTVMAETGILAHVMPEAEGLDHLLALIALGAEDPLIRLASMTNRDGDELAGLARRLKLSNKDSVRLKEMVAGKVSFPPDLDHSHLLAQTYWLGKERARALIQLDSAKDGLDRSWMLGVLDGWPVPEFPLSGADLIRLNIPPGPALGDLLRQLESWWVENDFAPDRASLRQHLATLID